MFAVRNNGVHGYVQHVGNLFVAQSFYDLNEYVSFAFAQFLCFRRVLLLAVRMSVVGECGIKNVVLDGAVVGKIVLGVPQFAHDADERIGHVASAGIRVSRVILDNEVLDLG